MKTLMQYSLIAILFLPASVTAQDVWQTVFKCTNGNNQIILMNRTTEFYLHGVKCLDRKCYLIEKSYDSYLLKKSGPYIYEGDGIALHANLETKTVYVSVSKGNLPEGEYFSCK